MISRRSVGGRVLGLAPLAGPNSLRRTASIGMANGLVPASHRNMVLQLVDRRPTRGLRRTSHIPARPVGNPPAFAGRSIFRLGLSISLRLAPPADPSAPGSAVNSRLSPGVPPSAPSGWQPPCLRGAAHLPARLVMSFQLHSDFCRRLAPAVSIRVPPSPHLRNISQWLTSDLHRRFFL